MTNRKNRLKKGISSIQKEIEKHEIKKQKAEEEGNLELASYYIAELAGLKKQKEQKENILDKQ